MLKEEKNIYNVGIYIRLSKEDENKTKESESESIINQRSLILSYIRDHNLTLTEEYVDDGFSGTTFDRPSFNRMINDIENGKINMVITKDLSRLGRDYIQSGYYLEQYFPMKKVRYISILDNIDTSIDSTNNDIAPFKALFNDMQSKDNSKKIRSILRDRKKQGLFLGSSTAFGYKRDPNNKHKLIIDEKTAPIVRRIFELALENKSNETIAHILNENNIITPIIYKNIKIAKRFRNPEVWTASSVYQILTNKMYTGNMVQGVQAKLNYKSKKRIVLDKNQWIEVKNTHQSIVTEEEYNLINTRPEKRKHLRTNREKQLLEGLVFCQECGCLLGLKIDKRNKKKIRYTMNCNRYTRNVKSNFCTSHFILYEKFEKDILKLIKSQYKNIHKNKIIDELEIIQQSHQENNFTNIKQLEQEKRELERKIQCLYNDKFKGIISEETYINLSKNTENELQNLTIKIEKIQELKKIKKDKTINNKELIEKLLNQKPKRELIFQLIDKITISKSKEVNIYYKFSNNQLIAHCDFTPLARINSTSKPTSSK